MVVRRARRQSMTDARRHRPAHGRGAAVDAGRPCCATRASSGSRSRSSRSPTACPTTSCASPPRSRRARRVPRRACARRRGRGRGGAPTPTASGRRRRRARRADGRGRRQRRRRRARCRCSTASRAALGRSTRRRDHDGGLSAGRQPARPRARSRASSSTPRRRRAGRDPRRAPRRRPRRPLHRAHPLHARARDRPRRPAARRAAPRRPRACGLTATIRRLPDRDDPADLIARRARTLDGRGAGAVNSARPGAATPPAPTPGDAASPARDDHEPRVGPERRALGVAVAAGLLESGAREHREQLGRGVHAQRDTCATRASPPVGISVWVVCATPEAGSNVRCSSSSRPSPSRCQSCSAKSRTSASRCMSRSRAGRSGRSTRRISASARVSCSSPR